MILAGNQEWYEITLISPMLYIDNQGKLDYLLKLNQICIFLLKFIAILSIVDIGYLL